MNCALLFRRINKSQLDLKKYIVSSCSYSSAPEQQKKRLNEETVINTPTNLRYVYPEFLPDPKSQWRNPLREKMERSDMIKRRTHIDIPEFYVGTIMAVTSSDLHSVGKVNRFVGICIHREGCGLRSKFILRNVIDHQGMEIMYEMYDPTLQKIEILRLEKRLDNKLFYLRDALAEYSTFDVNMEPEMLPENAPVPINTTKVILKPKPWLERWERQDLKGVENLKYDPCRATPWDKYDLMKEYKATIPEEDQKVIFTEVYSKLHQLEIMRKKMKRKRTFVLPKKKA